MEQTVGWKKEGDGIEGMIQEGRRWNEGQDLRMKEMEQTVGWKKAGFRHKVRMKEFGDCKN